MVENITQIIIDEKGNEIVNRPYTAKELNEKILKPYEINAAYAAFIKQNYNLQGEQFKEYHPSKEYNQYADAIEKYLKDKNIKVEISNLGRVRVNGEIEEQTDEFDYEQDDYKNGYLRLKNYPRLGRVYRLVAEAWLKRDPAQEEKVFEGNGSNIWDIHHITNNGYDNRPENLIWVKRKLHYGNENTVHGKWQWRKMNMANYDDVIMTQIIKSKGKEKITSKTRAEWKEIAAKGNQYLKDLPHEKFKDCPEEYIKGYPTVSRLEASNFGRIRATYTTGRIAILKSDYVLIAETWLEKDSAQKEMFPDGEWSVHHINNDANDNRPENLIWLKRELHKMIPTHK